MTKMLTNANTACRSGPGKRSLMNRNQEGKRDLCNGEKEIKNRPLLLYLRQKQARKR